MADYLGMLAAGLYTTLALSACAYPLALVVGIALAVARVSPVPPLRAFGAAYVTVLRNSPALVVLVIFIFVLPDAGLALSLFWSAVLALGLYLAAYVCETVRSGIDAIEVGQVEAARALGLPFRYLLRDIVLPLALRPMIAPLGTILINTVLGSSLCAAVGVGELSGAARSINLVTAQPFLVFGLTALIYLVINLGLGGLIGRVERAVRVHR